MARKGFSEKVTIEKHPELCKGMRAEGIQKHDYARHIQVNRMATVINTDQQSSFMIQIYLQLYDVVVICR